jgi:hypothetical protein
VTRARRLGEHSCAEVLRQRLDEQAGERDRAVNPAMGMIGMSVGMPASQASSSCATSSSFRYSGEIGDSIWW